MVFSRNYISITNLEVKKNLSEMLSETKERR